MSTSSIHFQRADYTFAEIHNSRQTERQPSYLLPEDKRQQNDFELLADVKKLHEVQMEIRKQNHSRGRSPTLTDSYWEAVVNLEERHSLTDVKKVAEHIRQKFKFTPTSISIHRDEGYVDKITGETKYNYHAHLTFYTIENGRSQMRLMTRSKLRDLQTEVADLLSMERGQQHSKAKRLDHQQYRAVKRAEEKTQLELVKTQKELNELKSKIRQQMIEQGGFSAQDYRSLNQLITDYKNAFKLGETVTVQDVIKDIYQRLNSTVKLKAENKRLTTENEKLQNEVEKLKQAQTERALERQNATVTVHNVEEQQKSSITPQKSTQRDESDIERVEVPQTPQSQSMSVLEQNTTKEKEYRIMFGANECFMTAQDIRDWLTDYPEERESIAQQLSDEDRLEVFNENRKEQRHSPRVDHGFSR